MFAFDAVSDDPVLQFLLLTECHQNHPLRPKPEPPVQRRVHFDIPPDHFSAIENDGTADGSTLRCFIISVQHALQIVQSRKKPFVPAPTVKEICKAIDFPEESTRFEICNGTSANGAHARLLAVICFIYNISLYIYTISKEGYLTKAVVRHEIPDTPLNRRFAIVSYGDHFELIVSETSHTPFHEVPDSLRPKVKLHRSEVKLEHKREHKEERPKKAQDVEKARKVEHELKRLQEQIKQVQISSDQAIARNLALQEQVERQQREISRLRQNK